jgi:hypothetical protein
MPTCMAGYLRKSGTQQGVVQHPVCLLCACHPATNSHIGQGTVCRSALQVTASDLRVSFAARHVTAPCRFIGLHSKSCTAANSNVQVGRHHSCISCTHMAVCAALVVCQTFGMPPTAKKNLNGPINCSLGPHQYVSQPQAQGLACESSRTAVVVTAQQLTVKSTVMEADCVDCCPPVGLMEATFTACWQRQQQQMSRQAVQQRLLLRLQHTHQGVGCLCMLSLSYGAYSHTYACCKPPLGRCAAACSLSHNLHAATSCWCLHTAGVMSKVSSTHDTQHDPNELHAPAAACCCLTNPLAPASCHTY